MTASVFFVHNKNALSVLLDSAFAMIRVLKGRIVMKRFFCLLSVLGFVFIFAAASASDAGKLPFEGIVGIALLGLFCLLLSRVGLRLLHRNSSVKNLSALDCRLVDRAG